MTIKRKQRLTLFQLWLEDRGRKAIGCFGPTAKENSGDRIAPLAKRPTRKERKLARILKVYVPKPAKKASLYPRWEGELPTARMVSGGRPGSKR